MIVRFALYVGVLFNSVQYIHICAYLLVKHPHPKSSLRGSLAQRVDEDIQGAEPPFHSEHLVGLNLVAERG